MFNNLKRDFKSIQSSSLCNCLLFHVTVNRNQGLLSTFTDQHPVFYHSRDCTKVWEDIFFFFSQSLSKCFWFLLSLLCFHCWFSILCTVYYRLDEGCLGYSLQVNIIGVCFQQSISRNICYLCNHALRVELVFLGMALGSPSLGCSFIHSKHSKEEWLWAGEHRGNIFQKENQQV